MTCLIKFIQFKIDVCLSVYVYKYILICVCVFVIALVEWISPTSYLSGPCRVSSDVMCSVLDPPTALFFL